MVAVWREDDPSGWMPIEARVSRHRKAEAHLTEGMCVLGPWTFNIDDVDRMVRERGNRLGETAERETRRRRPRSEPSLGAACAQEIVDRVQR